MKIILTLLCRNEADIVASTVDFHLRSGVDLIIATDNGSIDGTAEILQRYQERGVLRLLHEPNHNHDQAIWVSRMARMAAEEYQADWVIHCDADEFWWSPRCDFPAVFSNIPSSVMALSVGRVNFLPPPSESRQSDPFYLTQTLRERESLNSLGQPLPPKVCHRAHAEIVVADGNHSVMLAGEHLSPQVTDALEILHFPVRSYHQLERKIRDGAEALERNSRIPREVGLTWRRLYDEHLCAGTLPSYYASLRPDPDALSAALARGSLVEDQRLMKVMAQQTEP